MANESTDRTNQQPHVSRRAFVQSSSAAVAGAAIVPAALAPALFAASPAPDGRAPLRVGLVGCGGRGTGAAANAVEAADEVRIVALGDVFGDRVMACLGHLESLGDRVDVPNERRYVGFNAYKGVIKNPEVDAVILATPPHFRPAQFEMAVRYGKHVFMEKPVAVDPAGVRRVIEAGRLATEKNLGVVAGTQRRHERSYLAAMKHLEEGGIGDLVAARCYWNMGGLWRKDREPSWSDMEWQLRNWLYFTWLSGDHIVEQHIHNLDVVNWAMGAHPTRALGLGGRQVRTDPSYGHIFDHFAVEYEYPGDRFCLSMCRQIDNCANRVHETLHGTKGRMTLSPGRAEASGAQAWRFDEENPNPYVVEHRDLYRSIANGAPLNEAERVAESTLTAIMGRMATYTGQDVTWEQAMSSELDLTPAAYAMAEMPTPAVAMPGQTPLV